MVAACAPTAPQPGAGGSPAPSPQRAASPASAPPARPIDVFVIVMENRSYSEALSGPYESSLARTYELLTDYHAVAHPSLPNYLALTSGSTWGITDDGYHSLAGGRDLGSELTSRGIPWRAYMEGMRPRGCFSSGYPYALKHNPFAYYGGRCPPQVVPYAELASDLRSGAETFTWITPDLCDDGHDCSTAQADAWLSRSVPQILASPGWRSGGVLFITWDENEGGAGNQVAALVVTGRPTPQTDQTHYDHYSLLATIEGLLGVPALGAAARATPISLPR